MNIGASSRSNFSNNHIQVHKMDTGEILRIFPVSKTIKLLEPDTLSFSYPGK